MSNLWCTLTHLSVHLLHPLRKLTISHQCLEIKFILSFERRDHVESKHIIRNYLWLFRIPKKGYKPKIQPNYLKLPLDDLWGQSWPLMTKIAISLDSLTLKTYKMVWFIFLIYLFFSSFFANLLIYIFFRPFGQKVHHQIWTVAFACDVGTLQPSKKHYVISPIRRGHKPS